MNYHKIIENLDLKLMIIKMIIKELLFVLNVVLCNLK